MAPNVPLLLGAPEDFDLARELLVSVGFCEATLCPLLDIRNMSELGKVKWPTVGVEQFAPGLRCAVQTFLRGLAVAASEFDSTFGQAQVQALLRLGLLRPLKGDPSKLVSPVWLYPSDGFLMTSDRQTNPDGGDFVASEDVVFPAIYPGTVRFLELLPNAGGGAALDLCGGSGIGALHLARTASHTVTSDITARSCFFAEFNSRLNGAKVESLRGNLYEPVAGRQFDLITAHPPFVPNIGNRMVYRDGGDLGEDVTRGIIEGLPSALREGGRCMILCVARDTQTEPFEVRVRDWLGSAGTDFDIVFGLETILSSEQVADSMLKGRAGNTARSEILDMLNGSGTKQFVYGALHVIRCGNAASAFPLRVQLTMIGRDKDFQRVLHWRRLSRESGFSQWLALSRPRLSPRLQLTARHTVVEGELRPADFQFTVTDGLEACLRIDPWAATVLARFAGNLTVGDLFEELRASEELPLDFTLDAFLDLVRLAVERGFLEVNSFGKKSSALATQEA